MQKKKLSSLSELKTELAILIKDVNIGGNPDSKIAGYMPRVLVLREKHKAMYRKAARLKKRVEERIAQMTDPHKEILSLHYIQGLPLTKIESKVNYDYDYCQKIKSKGIRLYAK